MYPTAQAAAIAFLKRYNPQSIRINREIGGWVYKINSTYHHTPGQIQGPKGGILRSTCPPKSQLYGIVHTHARHDAELISEGIDYNEIFSQTDRNTAILNNVPSWIATPSGDIHRFNPDTRLYATVSKLPAIGRAPIK